MKRLESVAWDQWRALIRDLPDTDADRLAADVTAVLARQIDQMTTMQGERP